MANRKDTVYGVGLDASKFLAGMKAIRAEVQELQKQLSKKLTIQIDQRQFGQLTKALEQGFEGLGAKLSKAIRKGSDESVKAIYDLRNTVNAVAGQSEEALATHIAKGGKKGAAAAGQAIQAGITQGITGGMNSLDPAVNRFRDKVSATIKALQRQVSALGPEGQAHFANEALKRGAAINDAYIVQSDKKGDYISSQKTGMLKALIQASRDYEQQLQREAERTAELNRLDEGYRQASARRDETLTAEHRKNLAARAALENEFRTASYNKQLEFNRRLSKAEADRLAEDQKRARTLASLDQAFRTASNTRDDRVKTQLGTDFAQASRDRDRQIRQEQVDAAKRQAAVQREINQRLNETLQTHKGIGLSVADTALRLGKWLIFYRLIHDITRSIETTISSFVGRGLEYAKSLETQQLGLRGILAENFKITDAQGRQLTGAVALSELQGEAQKQWQQIQAASLAVVGTTEDLMGLYSGILPFAARLGKNLEDVQAMTKATAVAASLLDVSFQDARSALIAMLQGRALTRNRLVGILGISQEDIKSLKDTPALFDKIQSKLDEFLAMAPEAQKTLAATSETVKDFAGIVGYAFVKPITDAFTRFVGFLQGSLFEIGKAGELLPKEEFKSFLTFVGQAVTETIEPIREFGRTLVQQAGGDVRVWVLGITNALKPFIALAKVVAEAAVSFARFTALNFEFIRSLAWIAAVVTAVNVVQNLVARLREASMASGLLGTALRTLSGTVVQTQSAAQGATLATAAFTTSLRLLAAGTVIGVATAALGALIFKLSQWRAEAKAAKEVADSLASGDVLGGLVANTQLLESPDAGKQKEGAENVAKMATEAFQKLGRMGLDSTDKIVNANQTWKDQLADIEKQLDAIAAKGKNITEQDQERRKTLLAQLADVRAQKDAFSEQIGIINSVAAQAGKLERIAGDILKRKSKKDFTYGTGDVLDPDSALAQPAYGEHTRNVIEDTAVKDAKTIAALAEQLRNFQNSARQLREAFDHESQITLTPVPGEPKPDTKRPKLTSTYDEAVAIKKAQLDHEAELDKLAVAKREMLEDEAVQRQEEREIELTEFISQQLIKRQVEFLAHKKEMEKFAKGKSAQEQEDIRETLEKQQADINKDFTRNSLEAQNATLRLKIGQANRQATFEKLLEQYTEGVSAKEDEITGRIGDKAVDEFKKTIDAIKALVPQNADQKARKEELITRAQQAAGALGAHAQNEADLKASEATLNRLNEQERLLNEQFALNRISASAYAQALDELHEAQKKTLLAEQGQLENRQAELLSAPPGQQNTAELENIAVRLANIKAQLALINDIGEKVRLVFHSWVGLMGEASTYLDNFGGFGKTLGGIADEFTHIVQNSTAFIGVLSRIKELQAGIIGLKSAGGIGAALGRLGGAEEGAKATDFQKTMGALSAAGVAAGIGIGIATALFRRAVEKAKENIQKGIKDISDAISTGATTLGDGVAALEKARADAVSKYSGSKSGRAALKEILPDIDRQIADLQSRVKQVRQSFDEKLQTARLGTGPFADFGKMLLDLQNATREYLDSFAKDTEEYNQAKANINELLQLTLKQAKENLQSQALGYQEEAVQTAQHMIDLIDQHGQLLDQIADLQRQRQDLVAEQQDLENDRAEELANFEKERQDRAQKVLDIEKQIADVVRKAADDEAKIRQRGVLEATQTIAQQKASDISNVRYDAGNQLDSLKRQLTEAKDDTEFNNKITKALHNYEKQTAELKRQFENLQKQNVQLNQQLKLNEIDLGIQKALVGIEGQIYNISGNRYQLEQKRGELEIAQAKIKVSQWGQVDQLIRSIVQSGNGVIFNPPPGFPQIRVQIGDIVINNQDQSSTTVNQPPFPNTGGSGGGPAGGAGGGDRERRQYGGWQI